jgi:serine/threonine protein kinase/tetratricopeptide (TPR) repeat protein
VSRTPTPPEDRRTTRTVQVGPDGSGRIGDYRLLQKLGEGGMGEVWEAEQDRPVRRRVALKLIKAGMDSRQVVARFESERQALALITNPNIARVFAGGAPDRGAPYFAMELVRGEPITTYCDRQRMPMRARLELYLQVCEGIQHAHQKGIIHRDIKPSNVLVEVRDAGPVAKVIDFGVAKATEQRLTEKTMFTAMGVLIGTPEYMSPEQAEMTGLDVDTRTDVYSLGVLLYELLAGALPFDPTELRKAGFDGIRRRIREDEPSKPSTRVSAAGGASAEAAKQRGLDRSTLVRQLRGDLDWITMKALEKDRTRRYGSPAELAADIRRHLANEPVLASPPSSIYRARKFVRRHRFGVTAGGLVALALLLGMAGTTVGLVRATRAEATARQEAAAAEHVSEFLVGLFEVSDPSEARGNAVTAREILDKGAEKIERELGDQPVVQARMMSTIANVYRSLGLVPQAVGLLEQAVALRRQQLGDDHLDTLTSTLQLSKVYWILGRTDESFRLAAEGLERAGRVLGPEHVLTLDARIEVADHDMYTGDEKRAEEGRASHIETLEIKRRALGEEHRGTLYSMNRVAMIYVDQGRFDEAEALHLEALEIRRRVLGEDHPATLSSMNDLATAYLTHGYPDKAEPLLMQLVELGRRVGGGASNMAQYPLHNLALLCRILGRYEEAESWTRQVLELRQRWRGVDHPETLGSMGNLADVLARLGRHAEAEALYLETLDLARGRADGRWDSEASSLLGLARLYREQGDLAQADSYIDRFAAVDRGTNGFLLERVAAYHVLAGDLESAMTSLREAADLGYPPAWVRLDPDFATLRGRPEFESIVGNAGG